MLISPLMITDCWTGIRFSHFLIRVNLPNLEVLLTHVGQFACLDSSISGFPLSYASSELIARNLSNHLGQMSSLSIAGGIVGVIGSREKRSKQYRARSSHYSLMPPIFGYGLANGNVRFLLVS